MKNLKSYEEFNEPINEANEFITKKLGEFVAWYNGYFGDSKESDEEKYDAQNLFDNGGFETFKTSDHMQSFIKQYKENEAEIETRDGVDGRFEIEVNVGRMTFTVDSNKRAFE